MQVIISIMEQFGYFGIMFLIAIENVFPPIPSEVILTFGGFVTTKSSLTIPGVMFFSTLGSLIGALALYYIGKILNKERLKKLISGKIGKVLFLKPSDIDKADKWFDAKGNKTVFFCRFIPVVRSLISIPAGISQMPMKKFLLYTISGSFIWNSALIIAGNIVGENYTKVVEIISTYSKFILVLLLIIILVVIIIRRKKKRCSL